MMKLLGCFLLSIAVGAQAEAPDPLREFGAGGPYKVFEVNTSAPTPFMTGYIPETKECHLLVNMSVVQPIGFGRDVLIAHEAGHCHALRLGLQRIDGGVTQYGEAFGDVFALAWVSRYVPDKVDDALEYLWGVRSMNRQMNPEYNTMFVMRRARIDLPTTKDPVTFTRDLLQP